MILVLRLAQLTAFLEETAKAMDGDDRLVKVVHIASGDLWAGAEVQLYNLLLHLQSVPGVRLHVVLLNYGLLEQNLRKIGIDATVLDEQRLSSARIFLRLLRFLRTIRPDIIHTHRQKENVLGAIASALLSGTVSVRTVHGDQEWSASPWHIHKHMYRFLDRACGRFIQHIVAVSDPLGHVLERYFPRSRIRVIPNGIDIHAVQQAATMAVALPGKPRRVNIALIGRLVPVKRPDLFLQLASLAICRYGPIFNFYIYGDGPLKGDVERLIRELGIVEDVFLMGFTPAIAAHLARMNLLVITSDHEGLPMVLLEAISLRVPIIAHAVGGIPDALDNGRGGFLVQEHIPSGYLAALDCYLNNPASARERADHTHKHLFRFYSAERAASLYYALYFEILRRKFTNICNAHSETDIR